LYALDRLDPEQEQRVELHVLHCVPCQRATMRLTRQARLIRVAFSMIARNSSALA
jgi:hypothetical protein